MLEGKDKVCNFVKIKCFTLTVLTSEVSSTSTINYNYKKLPESTLYWNNNRKVTVLKYYLHTRFAKNNMTARELVFATMGAYVFHHKKVSFRAR